jgi:hypothetical protein
MELEQAHGRDMINLIQEDDSCDRALVHAYCVWDIHYDNVIKKISDLPDGKGKQFFKSAAQPAIDRFKDEKTKTSWRNNYNRS